MRREVSNEVKIGASVTPFQRIGKGPAVDKMFMTFTMLT